MPSPRRIAGLTLLELLTVAAIVGALAALVLTMAVALRDSSRRVVCRGNLRQWGSAILLHANDNKGLVPRTCLTHHPGNYAAAPSLILTRSVLPYEFSIDLMNQYVDGVSQLRLSDAAGNRNASLGTGGFTGIWNCPSTQWTKAGVGFSVAAWSTDTYRFAYCYFGWVNAWPNAASMTFSSAAHRLELMDRTPEPNRLMMCDQLSFSSAGANFDNQLWFLNHFRNSSRNEYEVQSQGGSGLAGASAADFAVRIADNPSKIAKRWAGGNQLWGDGHVEWKPASAFDRASMAPLTNPAPPPLPGSGGSSPGFRWYWYSAEAHFWAPRD